MNRQKLSDDSISMTRLPPSQLPQQTRNGINPGRSKLKATSTCEFSSSKKSSGHVTNIRPLFSSKYLQVKKQNLTTFNLKNLQVIKQILTTLKITQKTSSGQLIPGHFKNSSIRNKNYTQLTGQTGEKTYTWTPTPEQQQQAN